VDDHEHKPVIRREVISRRLGAILYTAAEWAQAVGNEALAPLGLQVRQWALLTLVGDHGPMSQQEAAQEIGVDRTTMVALVDGLERAGWILRERNPTDRRAYALRLTPTGRRVQKRGEKALDGSADVFFSSLSEAERTELRRLLLKLIEGRGIVAEHLAREGDR
jgi:DNA-binding MarR family transcriptional regulator